jgi:hypothetical protein
MLNNEIRMPNKMPNTKSHPSLLLTEEKKIVFTAFSKKLFYFRMQIQKFVLEQGYVPINPFMSFEYFLVDSVPRDVIRSANNNLIKRSDELWVFGDVSDGVAAEIVLAKQQGKPIRHFEVIDSMSIAETTAEKVAIESV